MRLKEVGYDKIFSPQTISSLKGKSGESLRQMLGNTNLRQALGRTMQLLPEISDAEADYIDELEPLAVQMVKDAYPIVDYAGIEIDAKITDMGEVIQLINKDKEEKTMIKSMEMRQQETPADAIPDDKKRRIINGITQGASVRGAFWFLLFKEYLNELDPSLIDKYKEIMNLSLGVYDNEQFIALLLASLAQNGAEGGGAGGASMVEVIKPLEDDDEDEWQGGSGEGEDPVLKITAKALNFPMLVYEIVKGLYEIVSLQGFGTDKGQNKNVVKRIDKLENEPDDLRYGKFIYDSISKLFNESEFEDKRIRELFFTEIYKLNDNEFFPFIENALNDKLTTAQKTWARNIMKDIESDLKADAADDALYN